MHEIEVITFNNYKIGLYILPIYSSKIVFMYYRDYEGYKRCLDYCSDIGLEVEDLKDNSWYICYGWMVKTEKNFHIVCLNLSGEGYFNYLNNTISHENYHLVQSISKHHGLSFTSKNDNEHIAYLIGYLSQELTKFVE
jgi:hypothetical protein